MSHCRWLYKISLGSLPLNSEKLSPVCSNLSQFAPVCPIYTQSQKLPRIHGVKFGSRFFRSSEPFCGSRWVTANCEQQLLAAWTLYVKVGQGREASANPLLVATMDPRSSTCTAQSEAPSSQCPLSRKRSSAFRFSPKLSFRG